MGSRVSVARGRLSILLMALVTALFFFPGVPAAAAGADIPLLIDCATESLQDAIDAALPGQTILPEGTCVETVIIHKDTEIDGRGQAVIDGGGQGPVVMIEPGVSARLVDMFIENGAAEFGAGVLNEGDLELVGVWVRDNGVDTSNVRTHRGAGIFNASGATLELLATYVTDNVAWWAAGGIYNHGSANVVDSSVYGNVATVRHNGDFSDPNTGGIVNAGVLSIVDSLFNGNLGRNVGAIDNRASGYMVVTRSAFIYHGEPCGNGAIEGGAMRNLGTAALTDTAFDHNHAAETGGAIANFGDLTVGSSTFTGNSTCDAGGGGGGGGLYNAGDAVVSSSLFNGNFAPDDHGGGIYNIGDLTVLDGTFLANSAERGGGAIANGPETPWPGPSLTINGARMVGNVSRDHGTLSNSGAMVAQDVQIELSLSEPAVYLAGDATISDLSLVDGVLSLDTPEWPVVPRPVVDIAASTFTNSRIDVLNGELHLTDSTMTGRTSEEKGGALFLGHNVIAELHNVALTGNGATEGGAVYVSPDAHLIADGVTLTGNVAVRGGGVYVHEAWAEFVNSDFDGNTASDSGGAGMVAWWGRLDLVDTSVIGNRATRGGALASDKSTLFVDGSWFNSNEAEIGGALYVTDGTISLQNAFLDHNFASQNGGAIAATNGSQLWVNNSTLNDHYADHNGGAVYVTDTAVRVIGSILNANNATDGAGVSASDRSVVTLIDSNMSYNLALGHGGGILNVASDLVLEGSTITQNQAGNDGGGVANRYGSAGSASLTAINSTIASNHGDDGSGISNRNGTLTLDHVTLTDNVRGPGLYEQTWAREAVVTNSIVAGNRVSDCAIAAFTSGGGNVFGPGCDLVNARTTDALDVVDPQLTFELPIGAVMGWYVPDAGSPAVDRVPVADCTQMLDQAGTVRPIGAGCDSGSIEAEATGPDTTPPAIDADFVHGDSFPSGVVNFTGAAADNVGVEWIGVAIQRLDTKKWLQDDGVSWGDFNRFEADLSAPGGTATDWSFSVALPDNRYVLSALAKDAAGNEGRIVPWRLFIVEGDATAPTVDADFSHNAELSIGSTLSGTAADNVGVTWVGIAVQDLATKKWLQDDMVSWGNFNRMPASLSNPGAVATDWSLVVDLPVGHYVLSARAKDAAGNSGYIVPWRGFYIVE